MRMAEKFLRDLQVPRQIENPLCQCVSEQMGMYWHAGLAADIPKRGLKRRISQRFTAPLAQGDPERLSDGKRSALVLQIALIYGPEIICDRNTMLIPRSLQTNHDESALAINIGKRHAQDA